MKAKKSDRLSEIKTSVYWSTQSKCPVLQVEPGQFVGKMRIDINDGAVYLGDPEKEDVETPQARARAHNEGFDLDEYREELERQAGFQSTPMEDALLAIANRLGESDWSDPITLVEEMADIIGEVLPSPGMARAPGEYEKQAAKQFLKNVAKQKWSEK